MLTTFILVFFVTFFLVLMIRLAVRKFTEINAQQYRSRARTASAQQRMEYTGHDPALSVYTIPSSTDSAVLYHRPPPAYTQAMLDEMQFGIPRSTTKDFVIISDKDLPSYDEVLAQKAGEIGHTETPIAAETNNNNNNCSADNVGVAANRNAEPQQITNGVPVIATATPMISTQLHVPQSQ